MFAIEKAVLGLKESLPVELSSKTGIVVLTVATILTKASTPGAISVNLKTSPCKNVLLFPSPVSSV